MRPSLMIGDLARRAGTKVNTVRFYEESGLLPQPARTASGRRTYGIEDLRRLTFIRHARSLGFGIDVVRSLLELVEHPERECGAASEIATRHLADVERRLRQLKALRTELRRMIAQCGEGRRVANCFILEGLGELVAAP